MSNWKQVVFFNVFLVAFEIHFFKIYYFIPFGVESIQLREIQIRIFQNVSTAEIFESFTIP